MTSACNVRFHVLSRSLEAWDKAITGVEGSRSAALKMTSIKVLRLLEDSDEDLRRELVAGRAGLDRKISSARIQKPGLALTGFTEHLHSERVQVFGNTEISYLRTLPESRQREVLNHLLQSQYVLACVLVTKNLDVPPPFVEPCDRAVLALLNSTLLSSALIQQIL